MTDSSASPAPPDATNAAVRSSAPERRRTLLGLIVPPLEPSWQRWVERPYFVWGARRSLGRISIMVCAIVSTVSAALMFALPPEWLATWWPIGPLAATLSALPLAVAFHRVLRELEEGGLLRDLTLTPTDRRVFAQAVLRRILRVGYAMFLSIVMAAGVLRLLGWAVFVDSVNNANAEFHVQNAVNTLLSTGAALLLAWHCGIVLLRLWDFVGESISNTAQYMGRVHRYFTMPLCVLMIPILAVFLLGSIGSAGVITSATLALSAWTGDGAWGWLPTLREHPFFLPLREDEF